MDTINVQRTIGDLNHYHSILRVISLAKSSTVSKTLHSKQKYERNIKRSRAVEDIGAKQLFLSLGSMVKKIRVK